MGAPQSTSTWCIPKNLGIKKVGHFAFRSCPTYCICKPLFLLHICSKSSTFAGLFAKGHFSSLPIVLSFSSLPLPPVLFLPVVWQVFRLLSRPRRFAGSPRNLDFWGAFSAEHIPPCVQTSRIPPLSIFTLYCLDLADFPASIFLPLHLKLYTLPLTLRADWTNR